MYASRLSQVVKKHLPSMHGYADDKQLYLSSHAGSDTSQDEATRVMEECIFDIHG